MAAADKGNVGLEEGLSRPPNVEAASGDAKVVVMNRRRHQQRHHRGHPNLPIERPQPQKHSKGSQKWPQRPKLPNYPPPPGSGMQAIFLDTWQNSPGTGFFLPQNDHKKFGSGRKMGSHVALVPLHVIEALNTNEHTLVPKIADGQGNLLLAENNNKNGKDNDGNGDSTKGNEKSTQLCWLSQNENISPDIYLPKEWTY